MAKKDFYLKCDKCSGRGFEEGPAAPPSEEIIRIDCTKCGGDGAIESGYVDDELLADIEDTKAKVDDIYDKVNDIWEKLNE